MLNIVYHFYIVLGWGFYLVLFFLGTILGSFLNSWIWRTRENIKIFTTGRSVCYHCHRQLLWYENIPLFSCIFLKRQCHCCHNFIPLRYPLVEFFAGVLLVFVGWHHIEVLGKFNFLWWCRDIMFVTFLIIIFVYDLLYQEILPSLIWLGVTLGFLLNYYILGYSVNTMVAGAFVAGGFFGLQYLISRGRWIGGGDVRLGVLMGIWLGFYGTLVAILFAYFSGALMAIILLLTKKANSKTAIPFGTFLALGTFVAMYYGGQVVNWYIGLIR
ncbi:MAG: prepilin peptidase [Candidatus Magasanikbacteria bacterium]